MAKNNNIIEEIQALIQQIKNNYQEGVDFEDYTITDKKTKNHEVGNLKIVSPRLKNFCRRRFNFPLGVNDYLSYYKGEHPNHFFYHTNRGEEGENDYLTFVIDGRPWEYFFSSRKDFEEWKKKNPDSHWNNSEEKKPKNCSVCGKLVFLKDGQMKLWNDECRAIGVMEDGYTIKTSKPFVLAHFHPECAEKYFADKKQPNEKSSRIKRKLIANLDKIALDPIGYLANAEIVKSKEVEENYQRGGGNDPVWNAWNDKVHKIEIEGEEINLTELEGEIKQEIRELIIQEIKSTPRDWKIEKSTIYEQPWKNIPDGFKVLKHKSGRRHWNVGIIYLNKSLEKGKQDWAEIEALINGSELPSKINDTELNWLKNIFQKYHINKITFENGTLFIDYDKEVNSLEKARVDKHLFQELREYCQSHHEKEITKAKLNINNNDNTNNLNPNKSNHQLAIGLAAGAGAVILGGIFVYLIRRRKDK